MKRVISLLAFLFGLLSVGVASAASMITADITTAINDLKTDVTTVGGLVFTVILVILAFAYLKRTAK